MPSSTPVPVRKVEVLMDFPKAIAAVGIGKKIHRTHEWQENEYGVMLDGRLKIHRDNRDFVWEITDGDILANDYIVIN